MTRLALACLVTSVAIAHAEEPPDRFYSVRFELANVVEVGPIATDAPACAAFKTPHTATEDELDDLAHCLAKIAWVRELEEVDAATGPDDRAFVAYTRKDGKIVKVGPVAPNKSDANLPTVLLELDTSELRPSAGLARVLGDRSLVTVVKVCTTDTGKQTGARAIVGSGFPAFDRELLAYIGKRTLAPVTVGGHAIAACSIIRVYYPYAVVGGVEGGD